MSSPADVAALLLRKARDDAYVARHLAADVAAPGWILGFHAQQAVEKALKAVLCFHRVEYPRTHNLAMLVELLRRARLDLPDDPDDLNGLIPFGVMARYEAALGESEIPLDRSWAVGAALRTIDWADRAMGRAASASGSSS